MRINSYKNSKVFNSPLNNSYYLTTFLAFFCSSYCIFILNFIIKHETTFGSPCFSTYSHNITAKKRSKKISDWDFDSIYF